MPHIAPLADEQASPEARGLFQDLQGQLKMVPNIFRTMGHDPAVLRATLLLNQAIHGHLDAKLRELAYLKTAQLNHCNYWLHYHKGLGRKAGLTNVQIEDLERFEQSDAYSDLEKSALRFAEQWCTRGKVEGDVIHDLDRSLSPQELVVLAATCALANWTGRFNETFGVQLP